MKVNHVGVVYASYNLVSRLYFDTPKAMGVETPSATVAYTATSAAHLYHYTGN